MKRIPLLAVLTLLSTLPGNADVLELKNGSVLNGKYLGGTAGTIRFETSAGIQVIETANAIALTFTSPPVAATATAPAPVAAAPAPAPSKTVTIPAGTLLLVRVTDGVSSQKKAGTKFTTKLEYDLATGGQVAVKGGTIIYGKVQSSTQARRAVGRSTLDLRLAEIIVGGQPVPIVSSGYKQAGANSIKKAAGGAAVGAAIGAIADDEAGKGAAIGATASLLKKGETVNVPAGTLIEFTLTQPVTINVTQ